MVKLYHLWVVGTTLLIGFIAYSSQIWIIWPWYGRVLSVDLLKLLIPFNLVVGMIWWNYRLCIITEPGAVPLGWRPNLDGSEHIEVKRSSAAPRYCKMCDHFKPPRAHHCRTCKTCVLKLDHHCPWIANCVGYFNHGHFIRFLVWVDIGTSYHLLMMIAKVRSIIADPYGEPSVSELLFMVFNFAACVPVWLCVGLFSLYHLWLISNNTTTIEKWEKDKVSVMVRRGKIQEIKYPYNLGTMANMKSVLGPNPLLWLWPQHQPGSGLSFPVNADDSRMQYAWPPRDPSKDYIPPPLPSNPFVYGDGLNPALVPNGGGVRRRGNGSGYVPPWETAVNSDGEVEMSGSDRSSSSPEPYLSDYDDDDNVPLGAMRGNMRVRRGSEGWEVRPAPGWSTGAENWGRDVEASGGAAAARPWERPGRYRVYDDGE